MKSLHSGLTLLWIPPGIFCLRRPPKIFWYWSQRIYTLNTVSHSNMMWQGWKFAQMHIPKKHLTSEVWWVSGVFNLCCAMKRMREFVSGEPRTPMLDLRLAFICARRDVPRARQWHSISAINGKYKLPLDSFGLWFLCISGPESTYITGLVTFVTEVGFNTLTCCF